MRLHAAWSLAIFLSPAAHAAIISVSGPTFLHASAPNSVGLGTQGSQFAHAWNERQQFTVSSLQVDILASSGHSNFPAPGLLSGQVDSHLLHWEHAWIQSGIRTGTITFNNPIVGVIFKFQTLNLSDALCKAPNTTYSTSSLRGIVPFVEFVKFSGSTLTYTYPTLPGFVDYTDVRVLTAVPAPASAAPLAIAAALARRPRRRSVA